MYILLITIGMSPSNNTQKWFKFQHLKLDPSLPNKKLNFNYEVKTVFLKIILFHQFVWYLPPLPLRNHMGTGSPSSRGDISNCSFAVNYLVTRNLPSENPTCKLSFFSPFLLSFTLVWICLHAREGRSKHFPLEMAFKERLKSHKLLLCPPRTGIQTPKTAEPLQHSLIFEAPLIYLIAELFG